MRYSTEDGSFDMGTLYSEGAKFSFILEGDAEYYAISNWDGNHKKTYWTVIKVDASAPSSWAVTQIEEAKQHKLVTDRVLSDYQQSITREEFSELVVKLYESLTGTTAELPELNKFSDTDNSEILKANALGIVNGVSETEFAPNASITREQIAVMFYNTLKAVDSSFINGEYSLSFADKDDVSKWATDAIAYMSGKGIISGVGENKINPKGNAKREEAIALVVRTFIAFK